MKPAADWNEGFFFLGNHHALDFLNTRPVQNGEAVELLPDFATLLRWFQAAGLLSTQQVARIRRGWGDSARARRTLEAALGLRERLRKEVVAWEAGGPIHRSFIDELNQLIAEHPMGSRLRATPGGLAREQWFDPAQPEDLLGPLADAAASLFVGVSRDRVRKCGNCLLHFHDTSKKGTRRWCSMQLCGNRLKVASYAARRRGT
jgi:predicted RNA-binding Zn ribbon-like protein